MSESRGAKTPPWVALFGASLLLGPALLIAAYALADVVQTDAWKPTPALASVAEDPSMDPAGVIAYVEHTGPEGGRGCIFVVAASGTEEPRRLGCAGVAGVPDPIGRIRWTPQGDLAVYDKTRTPAAVLPVGAGFAVNDAVPEAKRTRGYRGDGTLVRLADISEDKAQLALTPPGGATKTITTLDGPDSYQFGRPQWSPDGRWILVSDTEGRLLIADEQGNIRELLPANPARRWIEEPFLTWHQGETS